MCIRDRSEREERRKRGARIDPHGFDAGKLIKGKKRHILVDTLGLLLHAIVHAADVQDRDGGLLLLATLFGKFPFLENCLLYTSIGDGDANPYQLRTRCEGVVGLGVRRTGDDPARFVSRRARTQCDVIELLSLIHI